MRRSVIFFVVLLGIANPAAAQVFKWTDKDGRVHYGDDPAPAARDTREVTAQVNTLDMSALRRQSAESSAQSSIGGTSTAAKAARNAGQGTVSYPSCRRRR